MVPGGGRIFTPSIRNRPTFTYKMKIILGFFQITTGLVFAVDIPWPSHYRSFMRTFTFLTFDFIPWQVLTWILACTNYY